MEEISLFILDANGTERQIVLPTGISMSLMEALKAYDEPIVAICGGMALCASCHVEIIDGLDKLSAMTDDEEAMLDTLPELTDNSRLSCQVKIHRDMNGIRIRYAGGTSA